MHVHLCVLADHITSKFAENYHWKPRFGDINLKHSICYPCECVNNSNLSKFQSFEWTAPIKFDFNSEKSERKCWPFGKNSCFCWWCKIWSPWKFFGKSWKFFSCQREICRDLLDNIASHSNGTLNDSGVPNALLRCNVS